MVGLGDIRRAQILLDEARAASHCAPFTGRIVESPLLVDRVEDWSEVRSPSRAARRRRKRHRQRIRVVDVPRREVLVINGVMYAHPVVADEIRARLRSRGRELERSIDRMTLHLLSGRGQPW